MITNFINDTTFTTYIKGACLRADVFRRKIGSFQTSSSTWLSAKRPSFYKILSIGLISFSY